MSRATGIDGGAYAVKAVSGTLRGSTLVLERVVRIPTPPAEDRESAILDILGGLGTSSLRSREARLGLTGRDVIIRYTHVPPVPLWRLRLLMDFEVAEMARSSGDELSSDYNILTLPGGSESEETVMVGLAKTSFLSARLDALRRSRIGVRSAMPNSLALFNAFLGTGAPPDGEVTLLLDIGESNVEIAIQRDGELLFARNIAAGGRLFTEAIAAAFDADHAAADEIKRKYGNVPARGLAAHASGKEEKVANALVSVAGQFTAMAQSSVAFCRAQTKIADLRLGRVLLSGGGARLRGIDAYLSANLGCPVERLDLAATVDVSRLPDADRALFEEDPGAFAVAVGLARAGADPDAFVLDIVPAAVQRKRMLLRRTSFLVASAVVLLAAVGWHVVRLSDQAEAAEAARDRLQAEAQKRRRWERSYQAALRTARETADEARLLAGRGQAGFALAHAQGLVQRSAPEEIWITSIELGDREIAAGEGRDAPKVRRPVITVKGTVRQMESAPAEVYNRFLKALRADPARPRVETKDLPQAGDERPFTVLIDYPPEG